MKPPAESEVSKAGRRSVGARWGNFTCVWLVLGAVLGLAACSVLLARNMQRAGREKGLPSSYFSEDRARVHLDALAVDIGSRTVRWLADAKVFRPENGNVRAFTYIEKELHKLGHQVEVHGRKSAGQQKKVSALEAKVEQAATRDTRPKPQFLDLCEVDPSEFEVCSKPYLASDCTAEITHNTDAMNYIAARIRGSQSGRWKKALMLGCHLDSIGAPFNPGMHELWNPLVQSGKIVAHQNASSPGAADNAAACATMLEIGRSLAAEPVQADVILLFTNGQELNHIGAHRFVKDDPWFKDVGAFVEQDGSGAAGIAVPSLGDENEAFLVRAYSASAPHPHGSSTYNDFSSWQSQSTDGVVFRSLGVPTMTLQQMEDKCPYHSQYDVVDRIDEGSIQVNGENLHEFTRYLAGTEGVLEEWATESGPAKGTPRPVLFDFLSIVQLITYPWMVAVIVHLIVAFVCLSVTAWQLLDDFNEPEAVPDESELETSDSEDHFLQTLTTEFSLTEEHDWIQRAGKGGYRSRGMGVTQAFMMLSITVAAHICSIVGPMLEALLLSSFGKAGTWYGRDAFAFWLYGSHAVFIMILVHLPISSRCCALMANLSAKNVERLSGCAVVVLNSVAVIIATLAGFRCSYLWVWFALCRSLGMVAGWALDLSCFDTVPEFWWVEVLFMLPATILWFDTLRVWALNPIQSMGYFGGLTNNVEVDVAFYCSLMWQAAVPQVPFALRAGLKKLSLALLALVSGGTFVAALVLPVKDIYPCDKPRLV